MKTLAEKSINLDIRAHKNPCFCSFYSFLISSSPAKQRRWFMIWAFLSILSITPRNKTRDWSNENEARKLRSSTSLPSLFISLVWAFSCNLHKRLSDTAMIRWFLPPDFRVSSDARDHVMHRWRRQRRQAGSLALDHKHKTDIIHH